MEPMYREESARRAQPCSIPTPERYATIRAATEVLCARLSAEDAALQSMPDASPAKWHLAHSSWFFETFVLQPAVPGYRALSAAYHHLFNSYYQSMGTPYPRPQRGLLSRPSLDEVVAYRRHVDAWMTDLLATPGIAERSELLSVIELGLQHEQQHQELLLTDVKHLFFQNPLRPSYQAGAQARVATPVPDRPWCEHPGGIARIGYDGQGFFFDNERPRHRRLLEPFALASRLVTNGEWLAFMADGGYERPQLWLSDGFDAARAGGWRAPLYWERDDCGWQLFTLSGMQPVSPADPVCHVSAYEADAFARWARARLPGEDEWEVLAAGFLVEGNFVESGLLQPRAAWGEGDAPRQLFGDVWEWTRSPYGPYPGYQPPEGALGEYNGKFMANQWVLRGGSCVSPQGHLRASYRNFFPPSARWQFSGVRLARDLR
jgi:ergothioneine biosynthesis protein EgtB